MVLSPECIKISSKDCIAFAFVDIQHDPGKLRTGSAQRSDKNLRFCAEALAGNDAQKPVLPVHSAAAVEMPHDTAAALLVIGGDAVFVHKCDKGICCAVGEFILNGAALCRNDLVAAFPVKSGGSFPVHAANRQDPLVAVAFDQLTADDLASCDFLFSDPFKRVVHLCELKAQFFLVGHVATVTAAALAVAVAAGVNAGRGGEQQLFTARVGVGLQDLQDTDFPFLADDGPGDEDRTSFHMADAGGVGAVGVDGDASDLIFS